MLRFTLSSFPPTTSHLYFQRGRHRVLTDVARAWKASAQADVARAWKASAQAEVTEQVMSTPGYPEALAGLLGAKVRVVATFYGPSWICKNGSVRKKDVANMEKALWMPCSWA